MVFLQTELFKILSKIKFVDKIEENLAKTLKTRALMHDRG